MSTDNTALEQYREGSLDDRYRFATALAGAGDLIPTALHAFPVGENGQRVPGQSVPSAGKVLLVLETGAMLGLPPVAALQGIQVIEGKATLSAGMMSAVVRRAGHKLHVREEGTVEGGDLKVTAELIRSDDPEHPFTAVWTPHKAARAGLCVYRQGDGGIWQVIASGNRGPKPWQAYTEAMCRNRAISEVCRQGAEDALYGVHYTPEEAREVTVEVDGEPVAQAEPEVKAEAKPRRRAAVGKQGTKRAAEPAQEEPKPDEPVEAEVVEEPTPEPEQAPEPTEPSTEDVPMYAAVVDVEPGSGTRVEQGADGIPVLYADSTPAPDAPTDDSDVPPEEEPYELQSPERQQREAERTPSAPAPTGEPTDWTEELKRATTVAQVKAVWDATSGTPALTTDLRMAIIARKAELEAEEAKRQEQQA